MATYNMVSELRQASRKAPSERAIWYRLHGARRDGIVEMVRKGVYLPADLGNKFVIGCNAVENGVVAYHSALEYHLLQTQEFNELYVSADKSFRPFEYMGERYSYKKLKFIHKPISETVDGLQIRVTSVSQTLIDCIYNINLAGGIEELMYALAEVGPQLVVEKELIYCLRQYNKKSLWQRAGLLFSIFNARIGLSSKFFDLCRSEMGKNISYLINPYYCDSFNSDWNICIPRDLTSQIKAS